MATEATEKYVSYYQRGKTPEERFWEKVSPEPNSGCWLWTAGGNRYGTLWVDRDVKAHVFSWELHNGPVPDGLEVCHKCNIGWCVNPDHLYLGTHLQNMIDYWKTVKPWKTIGGYKHGKYVGRAHRIKEARAAQHYWGA